MLAIISATLGSAYTSVAREPRRRRLLVVSYHDNNSRELPPVRHWPGFDTRTLEQLRPPIGYNIDIFPTPRSPRYYGVRPHTFPWPGCLWQSSESLLVYKAQWSHLPDCLWCTPSTTLATPIYPLPASPSAAPPLRLLE